MCVCDCVCVSVCVYVCLCVYASVCLCKYVLCERFVQKKGLILTWNFRKYKKAFYHILFSFCLIYSQQCERGKYSYIYKCYTCIYRGHICKEDCWIFLDFLLIWSPNKQVRTFLHAVAINPLWFQLYEGMSCENAPFLILLTKGSDRILSGM